MAGLTGHLEGSVVPSPRLQKRSSTSLYATYPTLRRAVCCNSAYRMRFLQPSLRRLVQVSLSFRAVCLCHSERSVSVIPSGLFLSFRAVCSCHSERSVPVIPSAAKESLSCHFNQAEPLCHFDRAASLCHFNRAASLCHFDRAERVEKSFFEPTPRS